MNADVFVAGVGVISAIGNNVAECLSAFESEQAGMGPISYLNTVHRQEIPVAEVKLSNEELAFRAGGGIMDKPHRPVKRDSRKSRFG